MAISVAPATLPVPKKNSFYQVYLVATGMNANNSTFPVTWTVSAGALPAFLTLVKIADVLGGGTGGVVPLSIAAVQGKVPAVLNAATWSATIQASANADGTATATATTIATGIDGPDAQGYHGTEANRTTVTLLDTVDHGPGFAVADYLARMWPLTGPSQNT
jgi:hypothetical protein